MINSTRHHITGFCLHSLYAHCLYVLATLALIAGLLPAHADDNDIADISLAARKGDAEAQYQLANAYLTGEGLPKNPANAIKWYESAAKQEHVNAQLFIAHMNYTGLYTTKDIDAAAYWWDRAANNGNADAQVNLAITYLSRSASQQDITTARQWLQQAADQGHPRALEILPVLDPPEVAVVDTQTEPPASTPPAPPPEPDVPLSAADSSEASDDAWVFARRPDHYTLQLASFSNHTDRTAFLNRYDLDPAETRFIRSADDQWTYVLWGIYENTEQRDAAISMLHPELQPWSRNFRSIQNNRCAQLGSLNPDAYNRYCSQ